MRKHISQEDRNKNQLRFMKVMIGMSIIQVISMIVMFAFIYEIFH